ncbi:hypothetical protein [Streptomyces sp. NPDC058674]|uniref:hypothetical protein n=1 Tax=Streptomyces sp. NPDC058674 TaxID=3346592 RepID=UPI0036656D04
MAMAGSTQRGRRQAVVIVHGMGEQRPLDALTGFVRSGLPPDESGHRRYVSRPDIVTGKYESRRFVAPAAGNRPQTEFFEYHWAHLMQGNRLADMGPTFRRLLVRLPWRLPAGLRGVWLLFWGLVLTFAWVITFGPLSGHLDKLDEWPRVLTLLLGTSAFGVVLTFLLTHVGKAVPGMLTNSFVDVVRYLDSSPRSYAVRHEIRKGFVDLLKSLHTSRYEGMPRYERVVVVSHSLGAYIAYDGICQLWSEMNHRARKGATGAPDGLPHLERMAALLPPRGSKRTPSDAETTDFRRAQSRLWHGLRDQGNPWLITDFISAGTPMSFADLLYTRTREKFDEKVDRREIPTCPPQSYDRPRGTERTDLYYSHDWHDRSVVYDGAPFAVVRWTNLWFPAVPRAFGFFGDWFGGPLRPLFGNGILDIPVRGNLPKRLVPAFAHTLYFKYPDKRDNDSVTQHLQVALALGDLGTPPTGRQVERATKLLRENGFPTWKMSEKHADLLDPRNTLPSGRVKAWLCSMTRAEICNLIDSLEQRRKH